MIRQFGLYAPKFERWTEHRFVNETRSVLALFERHLTPPRESGKNWKISVEIVPEIEKPKVREALGNIKIQIEDDPTCFFELEAEEKKKQTLDWLFSGVEIVIRDLGWDIQPYEEARQAVLDLNFVNQWTWRKRVWWRNGRRLVAEVFVEHEIEEVRIYIQLRNRSKEILDRVLAVSDMPDEFVFDKYFGALQWINDTTVKLSPKSWAEGSWSVTFDSRHFPQ